MTCFSFLFDMSFGFDSPCADTSLEFGGSVVALFLFGSCSFVDIFAGLAVEAGGGAKGCFLVMKAGRVLCKQQRACDGVGYETRQA